MRYGYQDWVDDAPDSWKRDGFLTSRKPIAVSIRYGQNHPIRLDIDNINIEATSWNQAKRFQEAKFVTIAIATQLRSVLLWFSHYDALTYHSQSRCQSVDHFRTIPANTLIARHQNLFTSADPNERVELEDLNSFILLDQSQNEIPVFDINGVRIARREIAFNVDNRPHALLMTLPRLYRLFDATHDQDPGSDSDDSSNSVPTRRTNFVGYPQAFMRDIGHFQADTIPKALKAPLLTIEDMIHIRNLNEDHPDFDLNLFDGRAIVPKSTQGYNIGQHTMRNRVDNHDAQNARVTRCESTLFAGISRHPSAARYFFSFIFSFLAFLTFSKSTWSTIADGRFPHDIFAHKITSEDLRTDFRLEVVYTFQMAYIRPDLRVGSYVSTFIIIVYFPTLFLSK